MTLTQALAALEVAGKIRSRWLPGMAFRRGNKARAMLRRIHAASPSPGAVWAGWPGTWVRPQDRAELRDAAPDPHDPLTTMALLLLLREATGWETLETGFDGATGKWLARVPWYSHGGMSEVRVYGRGPTERAAIEAALVACAERL